MNYDELLAYKPSGTSSPPPDAHRVKQRKVMDDDNDDLGEGSSGPITAKDRDRILAMIEQESEPEEFTEADVKKMLLAFEKKLTKNQEMRLKFPDQPAKFMESEIDLHQEIQSLSVIATQPQFYSHVIEVGSVPSFVSLLGHENTDIVVAILHLLREMTDVDDDNMNFLMPLVQSLLKEQIITILKQSLSRLDESEKEGSDGVHDLLGILENMMDIDETTTISTSICNEPQLLPWLLRRIQATEFDSNTLYVSEIFSIILSKNEENKAIFGRFNGIEILLQTLAPYRNHDAQSLEEIEFVENLTDALSSSLDFGKNRTLFLDAQGLQLMLLFLKAKRQTQLAALKVLDHSMCKEAGDDACSAFVAQGGLKTLFPCFMKTPEKFRKGENAGQFEEHIAAIISSLLRNLKDESERARVLHKFLEDDFAKVERLIELHLNNLAKVVKKEKTQEIVAEELRRDGMEDDEIELLQYSERLDAGLFTLQLIDFIIAEVCVGCGQPAADRVSQLFRLKGKSVTSVKIVLLEFAENATAQDGSPTPFSERLTKLASYF